MKSRKYIGKTNIFYLKQCKVPLYGKRYMYKVKTNRFIKKKKLAHRRQRANIYKYTGVPLTKHPLLEQRMKRKIDKASEEIEEEVLNRTEMSNNHMQNTQTHQ